MALNSSTGIISGDPTDVGSVTTVSFTGRATAGAKTTDRSFNIIINPTYDGSTSAKHAGSPAQIASVLGTTPTTGVYWYGNAGYNSGTPFQAWTDWSTSNYATNGIMVLKQHAISGANVTNYTDVGTASTSTSGTLGHGNNFSTDPSGILSNWSGDTANRGIVLMYANNGSIGSDFGDTATLNWIEISKTPSVFKTMFDGNVGAGEFTGGITARSGGGTSDFYWSKNSNATEYNTGHRQMGNDATNSGWNQYNYMEIRQSGGDTNHGWFVDGNGTGQYCVGSSYNINRITVHGFSPNNTR